MGNRVLAVLLAAFALGAAAAPQSAAPEATIQLSEEQGLLRHQPTGLTFPKTLAGIARAASFPGNPAVVVYAPPGLQPDDPRRFAIAVGRAKGAPTVERMREQSRLHAGGGAAVEILFEGAFDWPGHPDARTFHASYIAGGLRKQYWHAWTAGYGITVIAEWPADQPEQMEKIALAVAGELFGGTAALR